MLLKSDEKSRMSFYHAQLACGWVYEPGYGYVYSSTATELKAN